MPDIQQPARSKSAGPRSDWIQWVLAAILSIVIISVFYKRFGLAWDDGLQAFLGEYSLNFYLTLGEDKSFLQLHNMASYGSVFETICAAVHRFSGLEDIFALRGFMCGLAAMGAVFFTVRLAAVSGVGRFAWFAGLLLLTSPQFWGQAFLNSKDIPFTAAYVAWWLSYILWFKNGFRPDRWMLLSAISLGLVLGIRIASIPLVGFTVCAGLAGWIFDCRSNRVSWKDVFLGYPWLYHVFILVAGWGVMTLVWPLALLNPIVNPIRAFSLFVSFPWEIDVLFGGSHYSSIALPRHAFLTEQFLSHPLWCYPLYILGVFSWLERWRSGERVHRFLCLSMVFWIVPLFAIFLVSPFSLYNGVRQSLFLWPAYAWLGAWGLSFLRNWLYAKKVSQIWSSLTGGTVIILNCLLLVYLHPFSYTYRNPVVNFFPGGANGFNTDYHALSYRIAAEWMDDLTLSRLSQQEEAPSVLVWAPKHATLSYSYFVRTPQDVGFTSSVPVEDYISKFEYFVILHPYQQRDSIIQLLDLQNRQLIHTIERNDTLFCLIYK